MTRWFAAAAAGRCAFAWGLLGVCIAPLAGCATPPPAATLGSACTVRRVARVPITYQGGYLVVSGALDGAPVRLLLGTASGYSMVTPQTVARLDLKRDPSRRSMVHGVDGTVLAPNVLVSAVSVGGLAMVDQSLAVGPAPQPAGAEEPIGGQIGTDLLARYDVELDAPHHVMTLFHTQGCGAGFSPWHAAATVIPLHRSPDDFLTMAVEVDGHKLTAIIDTASPATILTDAAVTRIGLADSDLARDRAIAGAGVTAEPFAAHLHRFASIRIGPGVYRQQTLVVAPVTLPGADMLVGADYVHTHHIWLSYATDRMFVAAH